MKPAGERKVERFGWTFAPGDKVMQIENDYDKELYNGDIGFVDVGTCSTPASPEAKDLSYWSARRKPLPSRYAMSRDGGGGQNWRNGWLPRQGPGD